ncbi:hypothetical protein M8C21_002189, partial [Ambrosia artemisiifolia]
SPKPQTPSPIPHNLTSIGPPPPVFQSSSGQVVLLPRPCDLCSVLPWPEHTHFVKPFVDEYWIAHK